MCGLGIFLWEKVIVKTESRQRMPVIAIYCCFVLLFVTNNKTGNICMYNVTFMRVRVTIAAVQKQ
jgi:hypothetical protein